MERFLADENVALSNVVLLRDVGHDVAAVREDTAGASDPDVLARAVHEGRILLTSDRDYGELIFRFLHPAPPGVVYFRFSTERSVELAAWVLRRLAEETRPLDGWYTTVRDQTTRRRRLP